MTVLGETEQEQQHVRDEALLARAPSVVAVLAATAAVTEQQGRPTAVGLRAVADLGDLA